MYIAETVRILGQNATLLHTMHLYIHSLEIRLCPVTCPIPPLGKLMAGKYCLTDLFRT